MRTGIPITVEVRADAVAEGPLFSPVDLPLRGFFFQPPPDDGSVASPVERLGQELGLEHSRLTLSGRPGHRTVFASSAELHHTLATELSSLTFASNADLIQRWVNVLQFRIDRDWMWDGLAEAGADVHRVVKRPGKDDVDQLAGTIHLSRAVPFAARTGVAAKPRAPERQFTDVFFFDAFDPKPAPNELPAEVTFEYRIVPAFKGGVPAPGPETLPELLVPITTRPTQTPKLVSAGIALSKFVPADDYSSTEPRARSLWLEFEARPADRDDTYFVRVLADAPDPVLTAEHIPESREAPLPIDPEWMRLIVPGQPRDSNGLNAMTWPGSEHARRRALDRAAATGPECLVTRAVRALHLRDQAWSYGLTLVECARPPRPRAARDGRPASRAAAGVPGRENRDCHSSPGAVCDTGVQGPQRPGAVSENGALDRAVRAREAGGWPLLAQSGSDPRGVVATPVDIQRRISARCSSGSHVWRGRDRNRRGS